MALRAGARRPARRSCEIRLKFYPAACCERSRASSLAPGSEAAEARPAGGLRRSLPHGHQAIRPHHRVTPAARRSPASGATSSSLAPCWSASVVGAAGAGRPDAGWAGVSSNAAPAEPAPDSTSRPRDADPIARGPAGAARAARGPASDAGSAGCRAGHDRARLALDDCRRRGDGGASPPISTRCSSSASTSSNRPSSCRPSPTGSSSRSPISSSGPSGWSSRPPFSSSSRSGSSPATGSCAGRRRSTPSISTAASPGGSASRSRRR